MSSLTCPRHITPPRSADTVVASHPTLDMSAWILNDGVEVLVMKGRIVPSSHPRPRDDVFAFRRLGSPSQTRATVKVLWRIDL